MGNFKVYTTFNKKYSGQTACSAWKWPKPQFWVPLTSWKFEPSPSPHTHSDPIINKHAEQVKKTTYGFIMVCTDLSATGQNSVTQWKAKIRLSWLSKKFQTHPPKPAEVKLSFRKVSLLPAKLRMLFTAHLLVREFGTKSTPSDTPWIEAYCPNSS